MVESMDPDEQLYEAAAKELASSPRTGLLAKCMAKSKGDENKAKARYLEVRVGEMKDIIRAEAKRKESEAREEEAIKRDEAKPDLGEIEFLPIIYTVLVVVIIITLSTIAIN